MRLFPVPYRMLPIDKQFAKYQWIEVDLKKAVSDHRVESHNLNIQTIKLGEKIGTEAEWSKRKTILRPIMQPSMCAMRRTLDANGNPTLGIFRPKRIKRLVIEASPAEWTADQKAILSQLTLGFENEPKDELEKIPFTFYYEFSCDEAECPGHKLSCTDWEMVQAFRSWRRKYGDKWEDKFRKRFEEEMIQKLDTHFYVGTLHKHPKNWIIVGLFYPPKPAKPDLFG